MDRTQKATNAVHVVDAFFIEGKNMIIDGKRIVSFAERHAALEVFVKSIVKKSRSDLDTVRLKDLVDFEKIENDILENLVPRKHKNTQLAANQGIHVPLSFASEYYVYPRGIYFFKYIKAPWSLAASSRTGRKYFYNCAANVSTYDVPGDDWLYADPR